jgi:predicted AlkP superfamily pyrophosphatase or phosphodiesterase
MLGTHPRVRALLLIVFAFALSSCRATAQSPTTSPSSTRERPTLVVFITIDQLATDYLARHGDDLDGGLKRLMREGAFWLRGVHDHAITETAPGHASTMSGRFPVSTGISSNSQGVNTRDVTLINSEDIGASPFRFQGTTLYDWMKAANSATRVLSVSRKDRGAILPIGRAPVDVYWYAPEGIFTTSTYYRRELPAWVHAFNSRRGGHRLAGRTWNTLRDASRYAEPDTVAIESAGQDYVFPHGFPTDSARAASVVRSTPWMDSLTMAIALEGVRAMQLGAAANRTDLLAVSLSATDAVGHQWGPDSRELHDQIVRLDAWLGTFLDSLFALRDQRRVLIALTADHGIAPFPELRSSYYANHAAQRVDLNRVMRYAKARMADDGLDSSAIGFDDGFRVLKPEVFRAASINPDHYARMWVEELRRTNGVQRADLLSDLASADTINDHIARRWLHMLPLDGPVRAVVTMTPFSYFTGVNYATHGSPHDYDALVPVIFWGAGIRGGPRDGTARVVDMAPTLADWLGIRPLERLDGRVLPLTP